MEARDRSPPAPTRVGTNAMWKLTIEDDEGSQTSLQLASAEYHIGRDEGNNVRLTDRNVSRRHATLKRNGDETWHLVDHESYNGSFVNGQRVSGNASLGHADLIQLGDYRIFLTNEERVMAPPTAANGKPAASSVPPAPEYPDRLVVVAGPEPGFECRLDRGVVTIGRSEECTFAINHPSVSRVHAVVHPVAPGRFEILDKDSANGLRINGADMRRKILEGGDVIEFGDVQMRYFEQGQAPRLGSDISQRLRALSMPSGPTSVRPAGPESEGARRRPGAGRWVALSLGLAALGAVAVVVQQSRPTKIEGANPPSSATPAAVADDGSNAVVERARGAVRAEPAEALRLLGTLPEPRRRAPDAAELTGQAADGLLREASKEADPAKRRPLLAPLLASPMVDAERRRQANDLLRPIEVVPPPPMPAAAETAPARASAGARERPPPRERLGGEEPAEPGVEAPRTASARAREREGRDREGAARPPPRTIKEPKEGEPAFNASQIVEGNQSRDDQAAREAAARRQLEGRMQSGKATVDDLRMLKAICQHQEDSGCRERAQEALRKLSE